MFRKIQLIGNVGKKPEIKQTQGGGQMATFSIAVNETYKAKSGERKQNTCWFNIVAFQSQERGLVTDLIQKYVDAGTLLFVDGTPNIRQWTDQSGNKRYSFEVNLDFNSTVKLLSKKSHEGGDRGDDAGGGEEAPRGSRSAPLDDDIPF